MRTIYTFGDSHTCLFQEAFRRPWGVTLTETNVRFVDKSCSPHTAYNLLEHDTTIKDVLSSIGFGPNDEMWFVFGEIDVRFHIFYEHQVRSISLSQSIEDTATRYTNYVKSLVDLGYMIRIVSVPPTQFNKIPHQNDPLRHLTMLNPVRGNGLTLECRIYITKKLNDLIQEKCDAFGIGFVNVYDYLVDPYTGCMKKHLCKDEGMHGYYMGDWVIEKYGLGKQND